LPQIDVDLGAHRPGTVIECLLTVENRTESDLVFSLVESGCKCLSLTPQAGVLADEASLSFKLKIATPTNPSRIQSEVGFVARRAGGSPVFAVRPYFQASGVVAFRANYVDVEIPVGVDHHQFDLPFLLGSDTKRELVDLSLKGSLSGIEAEIDFDAKSVKLRVDRQVLEKGDIAGSVILTNIETGASTDVTVDISESHPLTISPRSPVAYRIPDSQRYVCKVVASDKRPEGDGSKLKCNFFHESKMVSSTRVRSFGNIAIYEISIQLPDGSQSTPSSSELVCKLMSNGLQRTIKLPVLFSTPLPEQE